MSHAPLDTHRRLVADAPAAPQPSREEVLRTALLDANAFCRSMYRRVYELTQEAAPDIDTAAQRHALLAELRETLGRQNMVIQETGGWPEEGTPAPVSLAAWKDKCGVCDNLRPTGDGSIWRCAIARTRRSLLLWAYDARRDETRCGAAARHFKAKTLEGQTS